MNASFALYYLKNRFAVVERGASLVEYTLVLALIAVVAIGALTFLGDNTDKKLDDIGGAVSCEVGQVWDVDTNECVAS